MREHDALGRAGGAGGVKELGDFVFVEGEDIGALDAAARRGVPRRPSPDSTQLLHAGQAARK